MRHLATITVLFFSLNTFAQEKQCFCDKDPFMNTATVNCQTIILRNKSKLYWQFNCNKIWLTLENVKAQKITIDTMPIELYGYTYRLGYDLIKEYSNSLLFRSGCPANGPCIYTLIDKINGKKIDAFNQLICIDNDTTLDKKYQYDFIVYFSENYDNLKIYYIDTKKILTIPFDARTNNLTAVIPEYQFDNMVLNRNTLTLFYTTNDKKKLNLKINLSDKKYRH